MIYMNKLQLEILKQRQPKQFLFFDNVSKVVITQNTNQNLFVYILQKLPDATKVAFLR